MHTDMFKYIVCAALFWIGAQSTLHAADGKVAEVSETSVMPNTIPELLAAPSQHMGRNVAFRGRFASMADLFKSVNTEFAPEQHMNFAVWPEEAVMWNAEARKIVLPTLYAAKANKQLVDALRACQKYDVIEIVGVVTDTFAGYPWVLVTSVKQVGDAGDMLTDAAIGHMAAGEKALAHGAPAEACAQWERALEAGVPFANRALVYEQLARANHGMNQLDKACEWLIAALEIDADNPDLHLALADIALRFGDAEAAVSHAAAATAKSGASAEALGILAEAAALLGDFDRAGQCLENAGALPESKMLSVRHARVAARQNNLSDAATCYADAMQSMPDAAWLHHEAGLMYEREYLVKNDNAMLDKAISLFSRAAELTGNSDPAVMHSLAECQFRKQKSASAPDFVAVRDVLDKLDARIADYPAARIVEGRVLFAEGRPEEAEASYQTVAARVGDDADALIAMAEAFMDLQRFDNVLATLNRAKKVQPWNSRVQALADPLTQTAEPLLAEQIRARTEQKYAPVDTDAPTISPEMIAALEPLPYAVFDESLDGIPMTDRDLEPGPVMAAGAGASARYQVNGRSITVGEGDMVRTSEGIVSRLDDADLVSTSAMSAPLPVSRFDSLPSTEVRLDRLDVKFTNSSTARAIPAAKPEKAQQPKKSDATGEDEFEPISLMFSRSDEAFASMPIWSGEASEENTAPPFSFEPDHSPVLISGVRAPDNGKQARPVRNANLYRRAGPRVPAEIIEKETITPKPRLNPDASVMAPAADGAVRRAEVRLPSSAIGIGMASDYQPGKDTF